MGRLARDARSMRTFWTMQMTFIKIERKYMILGDSVRRGISDALNGSDRKFKMAKCPKCGADYSHIHFWGLSPEETGTRQGGYMIEIKFECECQNKAFVFAEHKGQVVYGEVKKDIRFETES